ncbi:hypothetical protein FG93_00040 [Bosea sp. LC85]|nr:hypothetical protein FG93_00040 [Bosea sp. LC85]
MIVLQREYHCLPCLLTLARRPEREGGLFVFDWLSSLSACPLSA